LWGIDQRSTGRRGDSLRNQLCQSLFKIGKRTTEAGTCPKR